MPESDDLAITRSGADRIDELEPLWRALQAHHVGLTPTLAGLSPRSAEDSWAAARQRYAEWLHDPDAFVLIAERAIARRVQALEREIAGVPPAAGSTPATREFLCTSKTIQLSTCSRRRRGDPQHLPLVRIG